MLTTHVESLFDKFNYEFQLEFIRFLRNHERVEQINEDNANGTTVELNDVLFDSKFWNVVVTEFLDSTYER